MNVCESVHECASCVREWVYSSAYGSGTVHVCESPPHVHECLCISMCPRVEHVYLQRSTILCVHTRLCVRLSIVCVGSLSES